MNRITGVIALAVAAAILWVAWGQKKDSVASSLMESEPWSRADADSSVDPEYYQASRQALPLSWTVTLPSDTEEETSGKRYAALIASVQSIHNARTNIMITPREALEDALARDDSLISAVAAMLSELDELKIGAIQSSDAERVIRNRMAAIDVLEVAAHEAVTPGNAEQAAEALVSIALGRYNAPATENGKRVRVSEQYDAFVALGRVNPQLAMQTLHRIANGKQRKFFRHAVVAAALDNGVLRQNMTEYMQNLEIKAPL